MEAIRRLPAAVARAWPHDDRVAAQRLRAVRTADVQPIDPDALGDAAPRGALQGMRALLLAQRDPVQVRRGRR